MDVFKPKLSKIPCPVASKVNPVTSSLATQSSGTSTNSTPAKRSYPNAATLTAQSDRAPLRLRTIYSAKPEPNTERSYQSKTFAKTPNGFLRGKNTTSSSSSNQSTLMPDKLTKIGEIASGKGESLLAPQPVSVSAEPKEPSQENQSNEYQSSKDSSGIITKESASGESSVLSSNLLPEAIPPLVLPKTGSFDHGSNKGDNENSAKMTQSQTQAPLKYDVARRCATGTRNLTRSFGIPHKKIEKLELVCDAASDKETAIRVLIGEIPDVWAELVNSIVDARNDIVAFLLEQQAIEYTEEYEKEAEEIFRSINWVKSQTAQKMQIVDEYLNYVNKELSENKKLKLDYEKLVNAKKSLSTKMTTLKFQVKTAETAVKNLKKSSEKEKLELESKYQQKMKQSAVVKEGLQKDLWEKTTALERVVNQTKHKSDQMKNKVEKAIVNEESRDVVCGRCGGDPHGSLGMQTSPNIEIMKCISPAENCEPGNEVESLKSLVRRLEKSVTLLSKQNEVLRGIVSNCQKEKPAAQFNKDPVCGLNESDITILTSTISSMREHIILTKNQRIMMEEKMVALERKAYRSNQMT